MFDIYFSEEKWARAGEWIRMMSCEMWQIWRICLCKKKGRLSWGEASWRVESGSGWWVVNAVWVSSFLHTSLFARSKSYESFGGVIQALEELWKLWWHRMTIQEEGLLYVLRSFNQFPANLPDGHNHLPRRQHVQKVSPSFTCSYLSPCMGENILRNT